MSEEEKEKRNETKPAPEPEKEQEIEFGTERPNSFTVTNSEDGSRKPRQ
jgi:hypothetical protein